MKSYAGIGSRETPEPVLAEMTRLALYLHDGPQLTLRSGGARGADLAFESGAPFRKEIWLPWRGYNGSDSRLITTGLAMALTAKYHPAWHNCSMGAKRMMARNANIVLGAKLDDPVDFIVCWTKHGQVIGGTGQALRIAAAFGIPVLNLALVKSDAVIEFVARQRASA